MDLSTASEAELLGLMAQGEDGSEQARSAWEELYLRHRRYLFAVVARSYGRFLGEDGIADLVVDTFCRAYEWARKQSDRRHLTERFSADSRDSTRRKVLGWLSAIAEHLLKDRFRGYASEAEDFVLFLEHWKSGKEQPGGVANSPALTLLTVALGELGAHDAEALRMSLPWYDLNSHMFAFPRGEAARVANLLGITPELLRQRRHRAIKHIEQHFQRAGYIITRHGEPS